ncbi:MAG: ribosome silencing factor [Acidimicrobiaceae bacterium]|nr:ribosome silencing factor [Acidimicrobiaceae bacterium]MCY4280356.1 ribosome silencing factor [Acidimicrobiaceae bacterium]MCY4293803.1 ribosome silencing factor [Acidimicrobiaceae bacterium]
MTAAAGEAASARDVSPTETAAIGSASARSSAGVSAAAESVDDSRSGDGALRWASAAAAAADERNGLDTVMIDVGDVLAVTDLFVITHGNNARQVRAIAEGVQELLKQAGGPSPARIEGADDRQWVLLDYGSFVVHVFDAERRELYQLERLWGDCPLLDWRSGTADR